VRTPYEQPPASGSLHVLFCVFCLLKRYPISPSEFILEFDFILQDSNPTVCVTHAGAGGGTPSDWENVEA
jgi:hypothetical protein